MSKQILVASVDVLEDQKVAIILKVDCSKNDLLNILGQIVATALIQVECGEHGKLSTFDLGAALSYDSVYVTECTTQSLEEGAGITDHGEFRRGMLAGVARYAREKKLLEIEDETVTWQ